MDLNKKNFKKYANIACSAQNVVEDLISEIFYIAHKKTGEKDFHFTGGVAMNSLAAMKLSNLEFVNSLNIPPSPGDSGAAIGSAYYSFLKSKNNFARRNKTSLSNLRFPGKFTIDKKLSEGFLNAGITLLAPIHVAILS